MDFSLSSYNTLDLSKYPRLKRYKQIYYIGDVSLLNLRGFTIVGSRKMSSYGERVVDYVVSGISNYKSSSISGFVDGVDLYTFKKSLTYGVPHIICLGYGIEYFYRNYFSSILKIIKNSNSLEFYDLLINRKILILSQFSPDQNAAQWTFPKRDELLASVGTCTIVVEAGVKSGTEYTVNRALKENKKVFSVPGSIFSPTSKGTNLLVKKSVTDKNIKPFLDIKDIVNILDLPSSTRLPISKKDSSSGDLIENKILNILNGESLYLDDISKALRMPVSKLSSVITKLEILGKVKKSGGKYYRADW